VFLADDFVQPPGDAVQRIVQHLERRVIPLVEAVRRGHPQRDHLLFAFEFDAPRIRPADDIDAASFSNAISDDTFEKLVAVLRIAVPYTGIIISTRESQRARERVLAVGVSQISGGSRTSVGGYTTEERHDETAQFDVNDLRTLDEVINWLLSMGYIPSFCTACYREGRTGDRFMQLVRAGQIANCCQPNALMTLKEYLEDYASPDTRQKGEQVIAAELEKIPNPKVRAIAADYIAKIHDGNRDFRF